MTQVAIRPSGTGRDIAAVREPWSECWTESGFSGEFQGFAAELRALPGAYAPPGGLLLAAFIMEVPAGSIALRPLNPSDCEAKHLYVRPVFRRQGIGQRLLERVIAEARSMGYRTLYGARFRP